MKKGLKVFLIVLAVAVFGFVCFRFGWAMAFSYMKHSAMEVLGRAFG